MKQWFMNLEPRERRALTIAAVFLAVMLVYALAWLPFARGYAQAQKTVAEQRETLAWMQQTALEVKGLQARQRAHGASKTNQSLLALVDDSAKKAGLGAYIRRVEPQGTEQVQIWLDNAPFDTVARWFATLQSDYGVSITTASAARQQAPGTANVRVLLQGAQS